MQWEIVLLNGDTITGDECYKMSYVYEIIKINKYYYDINGHYKLKEEIDWTYDIFTIPLTEVAYLKRTGLTNDDYTEYTKEVENIIKGLEEEFKNKSEQDKTIDETESCEKCQTEEYKSLPITDDSMYI